jgi:ankyrin repeat protein
VNTKDQAGRTPLHYAALENDLVRLGDLLAQGADPNAADELTLEPGRVDVGVVRSALDSIVGESLGGIWKKY